MDHHCVFTFLGGDNRTAWAKAHLAGAGCRTEEEFSDEVNAVVLPLPAFEGGHIRGGPKTAELLKELRPGMLILGGQLDPYRDQLAETGAIVLDYYKDEEFTAANAAITAEGAVSLMMQELKVCLFAAEILIIGWGRIGKLLAQKLTALGAKVTVAARKERDRGMIRALGMEAVPTGDYGDLKRFRVIVNTVPAPVIGAEDLKTAREDVLFMELASSPGGFPPEISKKLIRVGGLPGKYAPEQAGICIAQAVLRLIGGKNA